MEKEDKELGLSIYQGILDLFLNVKKEVDRYPNVEKYSLGPAIETEFSNALKAIRVSEKRRGCTKIFLEESIASLESANYLLNLSCSRRYVSKTKYRALSCRLSSFIRLIVSSAREEGVKESMKIKKQELEIHDRMYELLISLYPKFSSKKMKGNKVTTSAIKNDFFKYLSCIRKSSRVKSKRRQYALEAENSLENIITHIDILKAQNKIKENHYESIALELDIIQRQLRKYIQTS